MEKYVALLRGINVGGNNKVEMRRLKEVFEKNGCTNVITYINTGNVIFDLKKIETDVFTPKIETALSQEFGFSIRVVVRGQKNIKEIVKKIPENWKNNTEQKTDILFLWDEFDDRNSLELIETTTVDTLIYLSGVIVWNVNREDYKESGMNKFVGSMIYKNMTARNVNTVRKLGDLMN